MVNWIEYYERLAAVAACFYDPPQAVMLMQAGRRAERVLASLMETSNGFLLLAQGTRRRRDHL